MNNTFEILQNLIKKAVVFPKNNQEIVEYIAQQFNSESFSVQYVQNPVHSHSYGVIIRTIVPNKPYLLYAGHIDVVPDDCNGDHAGRWCYTKNPVISGKSLQWDESAKNMIEKDDKIYGRGSCDMLGSVASLISSLKQVDVNKLPHNIAIILADDEESQMMSSKKMLDILYPQIIDNGIIGCIVGEPTEMNVLIGQRGSCRGNIVIQGATSHVSRPDLGLDVFQEANKVYNYLSSQCKKEQHNHPADARFIPDDLYCRILDIKTDSAFKRTIGAVSLKFMINHLPTQNIEKILENTDKYVRILDNKLKQLNRQYRASFEIQKKYPSFICEQSNSFVSGLGRFLKQSNFSGAGFSSDAPVFAQKGILTVLLGPGSILQAHEPNEFIHKTQLEKAEEFWNKLLNQESRPVKSNILFDLYKKQNLR